MSNTAELSVEAQNGREANINTWIRIKVVKLAEPSFDLWQSEIISEQQRVTTLAKQQVSHRWSGDDESRLHLTAKML